MVNAIYSEFPLIEGKPDPLETSLIEGVPKAVDGEIIVLRNVKDFNAKIMRAKDVFIEFPESGHDQSRIVDFSQLGGYVEADKMTAHPHALRILTIRKDYVNPIRAMLAEVYQ